MLLSFIFDLVLKEPRLHPVRAQGLILEKLCRTIDDKNEFVQLFGGLSVVAVTSLISVVAYRIAANILRRIGLSDDVAEAIVLKPNFALKQLLEAADQAACSVVNNDVNVDEALKWLVSRSTSGLDVGHKYSAIVESCAENLNDSFIAPFFYYIAFGLPGAVVYRVINTADAMYGYHGQYEWLGKLMACCDDVASYIPARITALLIVVGGAVLLGKDAFVRGVKSIRRFGGATESPNAGQCISAMAGVLNIKLEKQGMYSIGQGELPELSDVNIAIMITFAAAFIFVISVFLLDAACYFHKIQ